MSDSPSSERWTICRRCANEGACNPCEAIEVVPESLLTQERQRVEELEATLEETLNELAVTHDRAEDLAERIEELEGAIARIEKALAQEEWGDDLEAEVQAAVASVQPRSEGYSGASGWRHPPPPDADRGDQE